MGASFVFVYAKQERAEVLSSFRVVFAGSAVQDYDDVHSVRRSVKRELSCRFEFSESQRLLH